MPTYDQGEDFRRDYARLTREERALFKVAVGKFVADVRVGLLRAVLRVRGVQDAPGVFEMTWAPDGRATFEYGPSVHEGERHVVWRRIGTHGIFERP